MGRARMERVRPCATHVHRSKLLFEMELDEIRYPPVHLHEHAMCADHGRPMHGRVMSLYSKWVALSRTVYSSRVRVTELPRLVLQHVNIRDFIIIIKFIDSVNF
jgi:hypothetical protein